MPILKNAQSKHFDPITLASSVRGCQTALWLFASLVLLTFHSGLANAQYQPVNCDPQGRIFVALGHTVLGIPDGAITTGGIAPLGDDPRHIAAPDETQKLGCYANPIQATGLLSMAQTYAFHEARWWSNKNYPVTDIRLRSLDLSKPGGMEDSQQNLNQDVCSHAVRRSDNNGIHICQRKETTPENSEMSFKISQARFPTYTKKDFSFTCPAQANVAGLGWCDTNLVITKDLQINLEFYLPAEGYGTDFPEKMMNLINSIKAAIDATVQHEYVWQNKQ